MKKECHVIISVDKRSANLVAFHGPLLVFHHQHVRRTMCRVRVGTVDLKMYVQKHLYVIVNYKNQYVHIQ